MNILHICNAAICDRFYDLFFERLIEHFENQYVYIPCSKEQLNTNELKRFDKYNKKIKVNIKPIKSRLDRVFYLKKKNKFFNSIITDYEYKNIQLVHAHSLWSDGGVAYEIYKKYGIPYIISIRVTDLTFFKYHPFLRNYIKKVLLNAKNIIYITPTLKNNTYMYLDENFQRKLERKTYIIPNGIDDFWIKNKNNLKSKEKEIKLIQVGRFNKNKNLITTVDLIMNLRQNGYNASCTFVGEGEYKRQILQYTSKRKLCKYITFHEFCSKEELIHHYRNANIFILPSLSETLGIVYLEAMSQGLPLVYTKNQGIDQFYPNGTIGYAVNPKSTKDMKVAIDKISQNYEKISNNCLKNVDGFAWDMIISKFYKIYFNKKER